MNVNSDDREKRNSVRTARLFLIGMGLLLTAGLTYLLVTGERRPWDAVRVLLLVGFYGVGLTAIVVGVLAKERAVAEWVGNIIDAKPEEILNPSPPAESPESSGRTAAKFVAYILLYGIVYFLASFGARFLIDEGKIVLGISLMIAALVTVGVWQLVTHLGSDSAVEGRALAGATRSEAALHATKFKSDTPHGEPPWRGGIAANPRSPDFCRSVPGRVSAWGFGFRGDSGQRRGRRPEGEHALVRAAL